MSRVFLHEVQEHAVEGGRAGAVPAVAWASDVGQVVRQDNLPGTPSLFGKGGGKAGQGFVVRHVPSALAVIAPWIRDRGAGEPPLEPPQFYVTQMLDELERRPAGRKAAGSQVSGRQRLELADKPGAEVVQVPKEDFGLDAAGVVGSGNGTVIASGHGFGWDVPHAEHGLPVLEAKKTHRSGIELEEAARAWLQPQPARAEHAQQVTV